MHSHYFYLLMFCRRYLLCGPNCVTTYFDRLQLDICWCKMYTSIDTIVMSLCNGDATMHSLMAKCGYLHVCQCQYGETDWPSIYLPFSWCLLMLSVPFYSTVYWILYGFSMYFHSGVCDLIYYRFHSLGSLWHIKASAFRSSDQIRIKAFKGTHRLREPNWMRRKCIDVGHLVILVNDIKPKIWGRVYEMVDTGLDRPADIGHTSDSYNWSRSTTWQDQQHYNKNKFCWISLGRTHNLFGVGIFHESEERVK